MTMGMIVKGGSHAVGGGRLVRRLHRLQRGESGVSLVEMLVAIGIFMLFSSLFVVTTIQFMRSMNMDAVRSQSASQINTAVQRIDSEARDAAGMKVSDDGNTVVIYVPQAATGTTSATTTDVAGRCVALTVAENSAGDQVIVYREKTAETTSSYPESGSVILSSLLNASSDPVFSSSDSSAFTSSFVFVPTVGKTMYGRTISSSAAKTLTARNSSAGGSADWGGLCPVPSTRGID